MPGSLISFLRQANAVYTCRKRIVSRAAGKLLAIHTMRFPDPRLLRSEFRCRGFGLATELLDVNERSALFRIASALAQRRATAVDRTDTGERLWYNVVTGDRIAAEGLPLFRFYTGPEMLSWIRELSGSPSLAPSSHLRSGINVNCLQTAGQQYPWHRDAVPYTSLLFLTSLPGSAGGAFLIRAADGELVRVQPRAGDLLFMDGARCPHAVAPLIESTLRLTVPMVYPTERIERPAGLDAYLYESAEGPHGIPVPSDPEPEPAPPSPIPVPDPSPDPPPTNPIPPPLPTDRVRHRR